MSMINEFVGKLISMLDELRKVESDREDYSDNHDYYDDWEYAFEDGASDGRHYAYVKSIKIIKELAEEYKDVPDTNAGKWIPVSEKLPEDDDNRFYMCIVENHEEDLPMFCQYAEDYGFGYWNDIYDSDSLGFLDSEFKTNDELGYEKVIAWQPLPQPYKGE